MNEATLATLFLALIALAFIVSIYYSSHRLKRRVARKYRRRRRQLEQPAQYQHQA